MLKEVLQGEGKLYHMKTWVFTKEWRTREMTYVWANIKYSFLSFKIIFITIDFKSKIMLF